MGLEFNHSVCPKRPGCGRALTKNAAKGRDFRNEAKKLT